MIPMYYSTFTLVFLKYITFAIFSYLTERSCSVRTQYTSHDYPSSPLPSSLLPSSPLFVSRKDSRMSEQPGEQASLLPTNKTSGSERSSLAEYAMHQLDKGLSLELSDEEDDDTVFTFNFKIDRTNSGGRTMSSSSPHIKRNSIIRKHSRTSSITSNPEKRLVKFSVGNDDRS